MQRTLLRSVGAAMLLAAVPFLSTMAASGSTGLPWKWHVAGTLSRHPVCSANAKPAALEICSYRAPNAPRANGVETGVITVKNSSTSAKCFGVSLSTSYMAGLQDFCVRAGRTGHYRTSGPASHYRAMQLSFFVTSGSKKVPIQPKVDTSHSSFSVVFSELR